MIFSSRTEIVTEKKICVFDISHLRHLDSTPLDSTLEPSIDCFDGSTPSFLVGDIPVACDVNALHPVIITTRRLPGHSTRTIRVGVGDYNSPSTRVQPPVWEYTVDRTLYRYVQRRQRRHPGRGKADTSNNLGPYYCPHYYYRHYLSLIHI